MNERRILDDEVSNLSNEGYSRGSFVGYGGFFDSQSQNKQQCK